MAAAQAKLASPGTVPNPGSAGLPQKIFPLNWKDAKLRDTPSISATSERYHTTPVGIAYFLIVSLLFYGAYNVF